MTRSCIARLVCVVHVAVGVAACDPPRSATSGDDAPVPDEATAETPRNGLLELPTCATTGSQTGGTALLYPRRALPALVAPGQEIELRVRMARSLMPAPGVQRSRALWGWNVRLAGHVDHVLGVAESDTPARRPAIRYVLPVLGVTADDAASLLYRVRVRIPVGVVPATYDLTVQRPGATVREPLAMRVIAAHREPRIVAGGSLGRTGLASDLARWRAAGVDLVVVETTAEHDGAAEVATMLTALERASATALLVVPPSAPTAAWAEGIAATGFLYAMHRRVYAMGRCLDGRAGPIAELAGSIRGGSAGAPSVASIGSSIGGDDANGARVEGPASRATEARDASGASVVDVGDPEAATELVIALRRGARLRCEPAARCRTIAIGVSPDAFAAPADAATGIVVSVSRGATVRMSSEHGQRGTLRIEGPREPVLAGNPFTLEARMPRGLTERRVIWALVAPPSADWALDEQPMREGARLRHHIRAPGTHELRALAIADDGSLASGETTVEVRAAATTACAAGHGATGGPRGSGLLLALAGSCFIAARARRRPGER